MLVTRSRHQRLKSDTTVQKTSRSVKILVKNLVKMGVSKKPKQSDIEIVNQKLKAAGVRLRVVVLNYKLYLRGTLPPRPGSTDNRPKEYDRKLM
jgi:hypothetical protein